MNISIQERAEALGVDHFGVADLSLAHAAILAQGGAEIASYPRAISVGIVLLNTIVDQLPQRAERAVCVEYRSHAYDIINDRLDFVTSRLGSALQRAGYRALPVPASKRVDDARICASFSHKMAAHLAGLGWIGKSCLFITPKNGARVRWATVLTDAPLEPTGRPSEEKCGECTECVTICPVQAFTGRPFHPSEPREARYDAAKCDRYFDSLKKVDAESAVCGLCLYICPVGRQ